MFLAVLPASAIQEAGGDVNRLPQELANRVGLAGTYGVVAGNSFRAGSTALPAGRAAALATAAFQANSGRGTQAVLVDFVNRVAAVAPAGNPNSGPFSGGQSGGGSPGAGAVSLLPVLLLLGVVVVGLYMWSKKRRREEAEVEAEVERDRSLLRAEVSVVAEDVMALEPQLALHPEARADFDAAVSRYRVAQAALADADDRIDLARVGRVVDEARYAMARARAIIEGREPPAPPADLSQPGRRGEPAVDLDDRGQPVYIGFGSPFYGGGWFGGGGGLLTGLFLGQMLGGGWGGWGGWGHDTNVYVDNGDGGAVGGDWGGGDWGGGDAGGGDWGGGDWGGGDVGGGDW
jgi:hypothetical protein